MDIKYRNKYLKYKMKYSKLKEEINNQNLQGGTFSGTFSSMVKKKFNDAQNVTQGLKQQIGKSPMVQDIRKNVSNGLNNIDNTLGKLITSINKEMTEKIEKISTLISTEKKKLLDDAFKNLDLFSKYTLLSKFFNKIYTKYIANLDNIPKQANETEKATIIKKANKIKQDLLNELLFLMNNTYLYKKIIIQESTDKSDSIKKCFSDNDNTNILSNIIINLFEKEVYNLPYDEQKNIFLYLFDILNTESKNTQANCDYLLIGSIIIDFYNSENALDEKIFNPNTYQNIINNIKYIKKQIS